MLNHLVSWWLLSDIPMPDTFLPDPDTWVDDQIIDYLTPNLVTFLGALGAIAVFRALLRF